jgi:sulfite reductase (NADPH) hemoprotein beta-component
MKEIEQLASRHGIDDKAIVIRMTGCPNGCARPYVAEIGLIGKGPGRYNLQLGGDGTGRRLNRLYRKNLNQQELIKTLDDLLADYAAHRQADEKFGDFVVRHGIVKAVINPAEDYHASE